MERKVTLSARSQCNVDRKALSYQRLKCGADERRRRLDAYRLLYRAASAPHGRRLGNRFRQSFTMHTLKCWFAATCSSTIGSKWGSLRGPNDTREELLISLAQVFAPLLLGALNQDCSRNDWCWCDTV